MNDIVIVLGVLIVIIAVLFMQITNFLLDIFIFFILLESMSCKKFLK